MLTSKYVPVLTTFQPTDEDGHLMMLQQQIDANQFPNYKTIYSQDLNEKFHDYNIECPNVPMFTLQMPRACDLERIAKNNIMVRIGTRITLIDETLRQDWWGAIRHSVILVRVNKPVIWTLISVSWVEGERCPFA